MVEFIRTQVSVFKPYIENCLYLDWREEVGWLIFAWSPSATVHLQSESLVRVQHTMHLTLMCYTPPVARQGLTARCPSRKVWFTSFLLADIWIFKMISVQGHEIPCFVDIRREKSFKVEHFFISPFSVFPNINDRQQCWMNLRVEVYTRPSRQLIVFDGKVRPSGNFT